MSSVVLMAAQEVQLLNPQVVAAAGTAVEQFVPAGWTIEQRLDGALTGAPQPDTVLQLIQQRDPRRPVSARALVILSRTADGTFKRSAVAIALLPPYRGFEFPVPAADVPSLDIARSVLTVAYRGTLARFRHDAASGQFRLIAEDHAFHYDTTYQSTPQLRMRGSGLVTTDYLTGMRLIEQREYDARAAKEVVVSDENEMVGGTQENIEQADWNADLFQRRLLAIAMYADLHVRPDDRMAVQDIHGNILRVPRILLAAFLHHLPPDESLPETLPDIAAQLVAQKVTLADPASRKEDRVLPADAEFYYLAGPSFVCGSGGCSHSLYWASMSTGQAEPLIDLDSPFSEFGHSADELIPSRNSTHGLFDIGNLKFDGRKYAGASR